VKCTTIESTLGNSRLLRGIASGKLFQPPFTVIQLARRIPPDGMLQSEYLLSNGHSHEDLRGQTIRSAQLNIDCEKRGTGQRMFQILAPVFSNVKLNREDMSATVIPPSRMWYKPQSMWLALKSLTTKIGCDDKVSKFINSPFDIETLGDRYCSE